MTPAGNDTSCGSAKRRARCSWRADDGEQCTWDEHSGNVHRMASRVEQALPTQVCHEGGTAHHVYDHAPRKNPPHNDAALAEHLRDPSTSTGLFPQEIRDQVAAELERAAMLAERWST